MFLFAAISPSLRRYPLHPRALFTLFLSPFYREFYRYLRLRFLSRADAVFSARRSRSSLKEYPSCLFLRASSCATRRGPTGDAVRESPPWVVGRWRRASCPGKIWSKYHKKKIKEVKYVWSRHAYIHVHIRTQLTVFHFTVDKPGVYTRMLITRFDKPKLANTDIT